MKKNNLNRVPMPKQKPKTRTKNFDEVALGYNSQQAKNEAERCIQCPNPTCIEGCPVEINIPGFIKAIVEDDMPEAVKILKEKNSLPGICGRVCPQEVQCEEKCVFAKKDAPVAIGRLERFVADWEQAHLKSSDQPLVKTKPKGKRIAVVGAGPAGLTVSADLAKLGHQVTIFEALHAPGGVLTYGIPNFRLPKNIVNNEIGYVKSLGVQIELDSVVGKKMTIDELLDNDFQAVFLGVGAGLPLFLNIPEENLNGVYSANEFLTRVNLMKAYKFPDYYTPIKVGKRIAVIGGGNVAMDSARTALRLGSEEVFIVYRRSETEMPARQEEIENAKEEGIKFKLLANPKRFLGDEQNWLKGMECYRTKLGEPDKSGRRRPLEIPGSEFIMDIDIAVVALGTSPNPLIAASTKDLEFTEKGTLLIDEKTGKTTKPGVWAGGDIVSGSATVISAMGAGQRAAKSIHATLMDSD
ncbi:MAG: NADPH-dependent glutamate synthase [Candidatus Aminicenantes bacterium]